MDYYEERPEYEDDRGLTVPVEVNVAWNNAAVINKVVGQVASRIYDDIWKEVQKKVTPMLEEQVNQAIAATLSQEVQPTDRFGSPTGEQIVIRELLMKNAEEWLTEKVDQYGRAGSSSYGKQLTRAEYLFGQLLKGSSDRKSPIEEMVKDTLKTKIGDVREMVQEAVNEQIREKLRGK